MNAILWDMPDPASHHCSTIISTAAVDGMKALPAVTIITETESPESCLDYLKKRLTDSGIQYNTSTLSECKPKGRLCIMLCEITCSVLRNPSPDNYDAVKRVFLESSGVLWVTRGALIEPSELDLSLVTGPEQ